MAIPAASALPLTLTRRLQDIHRGKRRGDHRPYGYAHSMQPDDGTILTVYYFTTRSPIRKKRVVLLVVGSMFSPPRA